MCIRGRDLDGTARSLRGVETEKEELSTLTMRLQKAIEVRRKKTKIVIRKSTEIDFKAERVRERDRFQITRGNCC